MNYSSSLLERFEKKYIPEPNSGCWLWLGSICGGGYGKIWSGSKLEGAHRVSYFLHHGDIDSSLYVLHRCDNKLCVNPDHLFLGTHTDNMRDMKLKQRGAIHERHGMAKLTLKDIEDIREKYSTEKCTHEKLATLYDVSSSLIGFIINRKIWI